MSYRSYIDRSLSEMLVPFENVGYVPGNDFWGCGCQSRGIDFDLFNWCFLQDNIVLVLVLLFMFLISHNGSCIFSCVVYALCLSSLLVRVIHLSLVSVLL